MRWIVSLLIAYLVAMPAAAEFRAIAFSENNIKELTRRCQMHSKNEEHETQLLYGFLLQTRFNGPKISSCTPSAENPCQKREWYPKEFSGVLTETNHHDEFQKAFFSFSGLDDQLMHELNFKVGKWYAFCAENQQQPTPKHPPRYVVYNYYTVYEMAK